MPTSRMAGGLGRTQVGESLAETWCPFFSHHNSSYLCCSLQRHPWKLAPLLGYQVGSSPEPIPPLPSLLQSPSVAKLHTSRPRCMWPGVQHVACIKATAPVQGLTRRPQKTTVSTNSNNYSSRSSCTHRVSTKGSPWHWDAPVT